MKIVVTFCSLLVFAAMAGCVSKSKAKAEAHRAYMAGRQETLRSVQRALGPSISVVGQVSNPIVPWAEGMTLAEVILQADYIAPQDPQIITIIRQSRAIPVDPKRLLRGEDMPVEAGDVVELH